MTVTIIGAGIIGCATAHELARRGARVRVIDPRGAGRGATRASAGILAPHIEGHSAPLLQLTRRSLDEYDAFIGRLRPETTGIPEYERTGSLQVAYDAAGETALIEAASRLRDAGVEHTLMDAERARRLEPRLSPQVMAALLVPQHGYVAVAPLMASLTGSAAAMGTVFSTEHVEGICVESGAPSVRTSAGTVETDVVVIAAGSWSTSGIGWLRPRLSTAASSSIVKPIRGQLVVLRAHARVAGHVLWGPRCYVVPWRDGSVLIGGTVENVGFNEQSSAGGVTRMLEAGIELLPALRDAAFEDVRVGLRPMTADELPIIGPSALASGVIYATGHFRNGVLLAPLTALLVADLILDGRVRPELALTRPDRFGL